MGDELKVYTINEIAEMTHIGRRTISMYIREGYLKAARVGKYWLVQEPDLLEFLTKGAPEIMSREAQKARAQAAAEKKGDNDND